jgi:DNA primase
MAGRIPREFIDDLLARIDIVDVINGRVTLKKAGKEYIACCPFHQEKTPSFTVSPTKQFYHCFGCGAHGSALGFLMEYERLTFPEAVEDLARTAGVQVPYDQQEQRQVDNSREYFALMEQVSRYFGNQLRQHPERAQAVDYLKQRGLSGKTAARFEIGYAPAGWQNVLNALGNSPKDKESLRTLGLTIKADSGREYDRFRERIMFPIRNLRGQVIGFGGRVLGDDTPKYLNSPETPIFHKGYELYGLYQARQQGNPEQLLVVEGYMDVISLAEQGIDYAVAALGTAVTEHQIKLLSRYSQRIVFCLDGDRAGYQAAWRSLETALPILSSKLQVKFVFLPEGEDPDSYVRQHGKAEFEQQIAAATPAVDFIFDQLLKQVDLGEIEGQALLIDKIRPLAMKLTDRTLQHLLVQRLAETLKMSVPDTRQNLGLSTSTRPVPSASPGSVADIKAYMQRIPVQVRNLIRLITEYPDFAGEIEDIQKLDTLRQPGIRFFQEIVDFIKQRPNISTGMLIEHWRNTEKGRLLDMMVAESNLISEKGARQEFTASLALLERKLKENETEALIAKSRSRQLTTAEKQKLNELLASTHN